MAGEKLENLISNQRKWDLVGPTVDDDVRRAIGRYGVEAVETALKRQTKPKKGRKPELDWPDLLPVIEADARDWLTGNDPFVARSNYSIAANFAHQKPGQSPSAVHKRIERKLKAKRVFMTLCAAMDISRDGYPYMDHIRALEALNVAKPHEVWKTTLEAKCRAVADYESKFGHPPPTTFSIDDVEEQLNNIQFVLEGRSGEQVSGGLGVLKAFNATLKQSIK